VAGGRNETASAVRRVSQARPNWWVILAVSLALIAVLVATGGSPGAHRRQGHPLADTPSRDAHKNASGPAASRHGTAAIPRALAPTSTSTTVPTSLRPTVRSTTTVPLLSTAGATSVTGPPVAPVTTTTVDPTTTTTVGPGVSQPADRTQQTGVMVPPGSMSHEYAFSGTGAMEVSVVWSGDTYLTLAVSCPSGSQSVGGTSAMVANLPDAEGACTATVTEPASESASLSYTITIGPAGG
jgi:hypothetical protein